ncbi:MAG: hypothetical protein QOJ44_2331 [Acidimicrobiaceae bacterium]|jgi:hypothetical protein|nr:hypothetical protein [Acidimicrobiaceae bacterium]
MPAHRFSRAVRCSIVVVFLAALAVLGGLSFTGGTPTDATGAVPPTGAHSRDASSTGTGTLSAVDVADTASSKDPFQGVLEYLHTRQGVAQVALFDKVTGKTYLLSDGTNAQYTASIVKADILAMWLKQLQGTPGSIPSNVPYSIEYLMRNMITMSDNAAATSLFYFGGGCNALTQFNTAIPTTDTTVGCESPTYYGWGNTTTTAADQVNIVRTFAYDNNILTTNARDYGLHLMESIIPGQRWGVTCGPWGTACNFPDYADPVPGVTVALKNGWKYVPTCTKQDESCPWQVNSMGWVQGKGRDYVLAVLTTDDPVGKGVVGFNYGIATTQGVSQRIWDNLAP